MYVYVYVLWLQNETFFFQKYPKQTKQQQKQKSSLVTTVAGWMREKVMEQSQWKPERQSHFELPLPTCNYNICLP